MTRPFRIAIVAGEASGDALAGHLIAALKERLPQVSFFGIGGPKMIAQGFDSWWAMENLSVMGYLEVLKRYRKIAAIRRQLKARLLESPPDIFIGVDAPDFNLGLEMALKARGIISIHYVSPSIWAWRGNRIHKIAKAVNRVLALFPMEPPLYEKQGIPVTYVGHPMADQIPLHTDKKEARALLNLLQLESPIYAMLPGSRQSELDRMADTFIQTAKIIHAQQPEARFLVPLATRETRLLFETALYRNEAIHLPFRLLFGHARDAMGAADTILVTSGTATLEAALIKRPMVVTYKVGATTYRLVKGRTYLPYVALPNILAGRFLVPELLQDDATPENLAQALLNLVADKRIASFLEEAFTEIHLQLKQNSAEKAAAAVIECLPA